MSGPRISGAAVDSLCEMAVWMYSIRMIVYVHCLRERGRPIPKYQFAFKVPLEGELTLGEERDSVLNRVSRVARLRMPGGGSVERELREAQLVELTRERLVLSGLERHEERALDVVEDFAQTWVCWFEAST